MYVIRRWKDGRFVTAGGERSYTIKLQDARTFRTWEAAERERCGNEYIEYIRDVMAPNPKGV